MLTKLIVLGTSIAAVAFVRWRLRTPSRRYEGIASVSERYDDWTNDGVLERYWADHLHAGHYGTPPVRKDFVAAKADFIDELVRWGVTGSNPTLGRRLEDADPAARPARVLDVGCGLGGSVRHMARRWPAARVTGITISRAQARRAAALAGDDGVDNADFVECDASNLAFADETFDLVWAVESEPHMADKPRFVREMVRVLKPGGTLVFAAWNVRDTRDAPLSRAERADLRIMLDQWCHAKFAPIHEYVALLEASALEGVATDDWTVPTQPSWRHAVRMGLRHPGPLAGLSASGLWSMARDAYTILCFDSAFRNGLCEYGVFRARKPAPGPVPALHAAGPAWQRAESQGSVA